MRSMKGDRGRFGRYVCLLVLTACLLMTGCSPEDESLTIFAAASTTDLMNTAAVMYQDEAGVELKLNLASSGNLARQLEAEAPADIFISASTKWMDYVGGLGLNGETAAWLQNDLVLVVPVDSELEMLDIPGGDLPGMVDLWLAMGDPAHVPAGQYGKEALEYYDWYESLEPRIQPTSDVRMALSMVEMGEADFGIVYRTDALKSDKVRIVSTFPAESHTPVLYMISMLEESSKGTEDLFEFLTGNEDMLELYESYGFTIPEESR